MESINFLSHVKNQSYRIRTNICAKLHKNICIFMTCLCVVADFSMWIHKDRHMNHFVKGCGMNKEYDKVAF